MLCLRPRRLTNLVPHHPHTRHHPYIHLTPTQMPTSTPLYAQEPQHYHQHMPAQARSASELFEDARRIGKVVAYLKNAVCFCTHFSHTRYF